MKRYKVYYAEFKKYPEEKEYQSMGIGDLLQGRYDNIKEVQNMIQERVLNLKNRPQLKTCEILYETEKEIRIKTIQNQTGKETIYHYVIVEFSLY